MPKASLILAFYNRIDYLKLVLAGLERQTIKDFEVIIADDGSYPEAVEEIEKISRQFDFPLIHLWHKDTGFRKNLILNKAVTSAKSEYLIFMDADCVPHSEFVKEHLLHKGPDRCLTGRRVNLSEKITSMLTPANIKEGFLEKNLLLLIDDGLFGKSFDIEKGIYFQSEFLRTYFNKKKRGILGCNFSVHTADLLKINGFDERYKAPSIGEDTDVEYRLSLCGVSIKSLNNIAVQYHLYHKLQERPEENLALFRETQIKNIFFTGYGIKKIRDKNL